MVSLSIRNLCLVYFICSLLLSSCLMQQGVQVTRTFTSLTADTTTLAIDKTVRVYFSAEPVPFSYQKIGLIEVAGADGSTTEQLLNHLRYQAYAQGADAVIGVKDDYKTRTQGIGIKQENQRPYSSHCYSGIAVKIDASFTGLPRPLAADTAYFGQIKAYDLQQAKRSGGEFIGSLVLGLAILVAVIVLAGR